MKRKILFKFATRARPGIFKRVLELYYQKLSHKHPFEFIISADVDDPTMNNPEMIAYMKQKPNLRFFFGNSKTKIEAINTDMQGAEFDILVVVSDDMEPQVSHFDDIIVTHMNQHFPDMDGALHYNDGCCGQERTITLSIMGRELYNYLGYIYHPAYVSFYCDNEFTEVVRKLSKVKYFPQVIIKHTWKGDTSDLLYKRNSKMGRGDAQIFANRKSQGFPKI